jgi:hypothetical protein
VHLNSRFVSHKTIFSSYTELRNVDYVLPIIARWNFILAARPIVVERLFPQEEEQKSVPKDSPAAQGLLKRVSAFCSISFSCSIQKLDPLAVDLLVCAFFSTALCIGDRNSLTVH